MLPLALLAIAATLLALAPGAAAEQPPPTAYCDPERREFDPTDLRPTRLVAPPGMRLRYVTLGGVETPVFEAGSVDASEAVVFVHGNPGSAQDWLQLMRIAGRYGRALAFDLPGFGRAATPHRFQYDLHNFTRWLAAMLEQLGVHRVHLVVHDIGGPVGMQWAAEHPSSFASAVIIASGLLLGYEHHEYAQVWRSPGGGEASMLSIDRERFNQAVHYGQTKPLPREFVDRMYDDFDRRTRCAVLRLYRSTDDPDSEFARAQAATLRPLDRPALVVWGRHDPYLPAEMAERQREGFPRARVEVFEDAAHWPFVDEAERVEQLVEPFLKSVLPPAARPQLRVRLRRSAARGDRSVALRVIVHRALVAQGVRAVLRRGGRVTGTTGPPVAVVRGRNLRIRLREPLRSTRSQVLTVTAADAGPARLTVRPR